MISYARSVCQGGFHLWFCGTAINTNGAPSTCTPTPTSPSFFHPGSGLNGFYAEAGVFVLCATLLVDTTVDEQACTQPASVHFLRNALTLVGISLLCCGSKPPNRNDFFAYPMGLCQAGGSAVREGSWPLVHPLFTGTLSLLSLTEMPSRNVHYLL